MNAAVCVWSIFVIPPDAADYLRDSAIAGDPQATRLLAACADFHRNIGGITTPAQATQSCMICEVPFWQRNAPQLIVVINVLDDDSAPTTCGICAECYSTHRASHTIKDAVMAGCRVRLAIPDLRWLPPMVAAEGHA